MSFATEINKSVSDFRILVDIVNIASTWSGHYSFNTFTPLGGTFSYEGRLNNVPSVSINRDSSFFGVLTYSSSSIEVINTDGDLDDICEDYSINGASVKIYIGFEDIYLSTYSCIYTGYVEGVNINEKTVSFSVADLRKRLKQTNHVSRLQYNAVTFIQDILTETYSITYDSTYFDTTAWEIARALAPNVSRFRPENDTVDDAIQDIISSSFGFFYIDNSTGKYSIKIIDTAATSVTSINKYDILNDINIEYNTDKVLASVRSKVPKWNDWGTGATFDSSVQSVYCFLDLTTSQLIGTAPYGSFYKSIDNGNSWNFIYRPGSEEYIRTMINAGSGKLLAGTYPGGSVQISTDSGSSWSVLAFLSSTETYVRSLINTGTAGSILAATTPNAKIFKSIDCGSSWSQVATIAGEVSAGPLCVLSAGTILAGTYPGGAIVRSLDNGSTWSYIQDLGTSNAVNEILSLGSGIALAATGSTTGNIYKSIDSGSSWSVVQQLGNETSIYSMINLGYGVCFAGTYPTAQVYQTKDYGSSWTLMQRLGSESEVQSFILLDTGIVLAGTGYDRKIYKTTFSSWDWIEDTSHKASVYSSYQIDTNKDYNTIFQTSAYASAFNTAILNYFKDVHGESTIEVSMKYYAIKIGENVDISLDRTTKTMLGTKKCEIIGISYNLNRPSINFRIRII